MNSARDAFIAGNYEKAQQLVDNAIRKVPNDTALHEFRALTLFAQKKYRDAAATIHSVLAVGPGWDWDTLKSFYTSVDTYTAQLRALEDYVKQNPNAADAHFLLAYEYLTLQYMDQATKQLQFVVKLQPDDELAAIMLKSLSKPADSDRPAPRDN